MPIQNAPYCEGTEEARIEVRDFLSKILKGTETEEEIEVTLHETSKGSIGREIEGYRIGFDADELERKVKEIVDDASRQALTLHGRVKFTVRVTGRRTTLLIALDVPSTHDDDDDDDDDDPDLDPPNKRGLINQAQRFAENSQKELRLAAKGQRDLMKDQRQFTKDLQEENRQLREANRSMLRLEQELHNMQLERDLARHDRERSNQRKDQFIGAVGKMLPAVGASIMGIDPKMLMAAMAPPQPSPSLSPAAAPPAGSAEPRTPIEAAAEALMSSLSAEQAQQIAKIISPEQFGILHQLHSLLSERLDRDKARAAETLKTEANGSSPTNGRASAYGGAS